MSDTDDFADTTPSRWLSAWAIFRLIIMPLAIIAMLWGALLWVASWAKAEGYESSYVTRRVAHRSCDWVGNCEVYYRYIRVRRPVYEPRVYGYERREPEARRYEPRDHSPHCLSPVRVVGAEHNSEDGAMGDAQRQWAATVRHDSGERYMTLDLARDVATVCDRSSSNESWTGKIVEGAARAANIEGAFRKRCVIVGTPCRAQLVRDNDRRR